MAVAVGLAVAVGPAAMADGQYVQNGPATDPSLRVRRRSPCRYARVPADPARRGRFVTFTTNYASDYPTLVAPPPAPPAPGNESRPTRQ